MKKAVFVLKVMFILLNQQFELLGIDTTTLQFIEVLNSRYVEIYPTITPDGNRLYFTSLRRSGDYSSPGHFTINGQHQYDGDIWVSEMENGEWTNPKLIGRHINTPLREDECTVFDGGQKVVFESWKTGWELDGGPYYVSELDGNQWKTPRGLGGGINEFFKEREKDRHDRFDTDLNQTFSKTERDYLMGLMSSDFERFKIVANSKGFDEQMYRRFTDGATINEGGDLFIFAVSDFQADTINMDIHFSRKDNNGNWSYPIKLKLNTSHDEICPNLHDDNQTMYFSSDRIGGYGGYDIYRSKISELDHDIEVNNIGEQYNSVSDEFALIVDGAGKNGILVRDFNLYGVSVAPEIAPERVITIKGQVVNYKGQPAYLPISFNKYGPDSTQNDIVDDFPTMVPKNT